MRENKAMGLILPNVSVGSLGSLCDSRTVGSIPFGGRYRLIDFTLSNMVHSGIFDVGVFTRNKYESLMNHLGSGRDWDLSRKYGGLTLLPPFLGDNGTVAYRGEIEPMFTYRNYISDTPARYVVLSDPDIVGQIDFDSLISAHAESNATITVAYQRVTNERDVGENPILLSFAEDRLDEVTIGGRYKGECNRYMGIMVMAKETLISIIDEFTARNLYSLSRDLLQGACHQITIKGVEISGCVKIQSLESYFRTSMGLLDPTMRRSIFNPASPVLTRVRDEAPVRYGLNASVKNSLVADGAMIYGTVEDSIIFRKVKIGAGAVVKNCIIMDGTEIADNASLSYVVADRRCYINEGRIITGFLSYPVVIGKESIV